MTTDNEPVDVGDLTGQLCERLGVKPEYVYCLEVGVSEAKVHLYKGMDGFCTGAKYVADANGVPVAGRYAGDPAVTEPTGPATEILTVPVTTHD